MLVYASLYPDTLKFEITVHKNTLCREAGYAFLFFGKVSTHRLQLFPGLTLRNKVCLTVVCTGRGMHAHTDAFHINWSLCYTAFGRQARSAGIYVAALSFVILVTFGLKSFLGIVLQLLMRKSVLLGEISYERC